MLRWLGLGAFLTLGSALLWALAAQQCQTRLGAALVAWSGIVASAWLVPVWWIFNLVLYSIAAGLRYVSQALLGNNHSAEAYFAEVRDCGKSWVVVAAEWGLKQYNAPWFVQAATPEVIEIVAPLLDQPLVRGLEESRQQTLGKLKTAIQVTEIIRYVWAALIFVPLWGSLLLLVW